MTRRAAYRFSRLNLPPTPPSHRQNVGSNDMAGPEFPEYATSYSKSARALRDVLPAPLRAVLIDIEDELAEDPDKYPTRLIPLAEDLFIYKHPQPAIEVTYRIDRERKIIYFLH